LDTIPYDFFDEKIISGQGGLARPDSIYPDTTLAKIAVDEGRIRPGDQHLAPTFYMVYEIEDWLTETVKARMVE